VRIFVLLVSLCCWLSPSPVFAQDSDPAAQQDQEAARQKILKAADQIDMIETNSETTKSSVELMKSDLAKLQADNLALKQQLANLQAAFDKAEASRAKERQALLDEVAELVKAGKSPGTKKKTTPAAAASEPTDSTPSTPPSDAGAQATIATAPSLAPPPDPGSTPTATTSDNNPPPPKPPQKGYYHVVESGETLTMICAAYRQNGVKVTVSQVRKANGLTETSVLKVGQKLFIPKPAN
jgi:LysM repeat protein